MSMLYIFFFRVNVATLKWRDTSSDVSLSHPSDILLCTRDESREEDEGCRYYRHEVGNYQH